MVSICILFLGTTEGHRSLEKSAEEHYLFDCIISSMLKIVVGYLNIQNQSAFLVKNGWVSNVVI